jgi:hypothetical protein
VAGFFQTNNEECSAWTAVTLIPGNGVTLPVLLIYLQQLKKKANYYKI